jgi:hypothetical protein
MPDRPFLLHFSRKPLRVIGTDIERRADDLTLEDFHPRPAFRDEQPRRAASTGRTDVDRETTDDE